MVICFETTTEAKKALDSLIETRKFRDISEAISMALVNYQVIQRAVAQGGRIIIDDFSAHGAEREPNAATSKAQPSKTREAVTAAAVACAIPELFALKDARLEAMEFLPVPDVPQRGATDLPPAQWLFGQYNKLL